MPALSKGFSQGLALSIPLAVKKFEIEAAQKKWETEMDMKQDELNLANDELEAEKREAKTKLLIESAQKFQEAGDQRGLDSIHEQLRGLGHSGVPEVPAMSPGVLDIAQQLRGEGGVPLEEGIPRKFYTPQTEQGKFEAKEKLKQEHKIELEGVRQAGKVKPSDKPPYKVGQIIKIPIGDENISFQKTGNDSDVVDLPDGGKLVGFKELARSTMTKGERDIDKRKASLPALIQQVAADPNKAYTRKVKLEIDEMGRPSVYQNPFKEGAPEPLPEFEKVAGKRGAPKALMAMGEQYDDAVELQTLLNDPKVAEDLRREIDSGLIDRIKSKVGNKLNKWMAERGIAADSDTATAIRRMQRLASEERKQFMGVAVTELEIKSALAWMPDAADSYDAMVNKINLMAQEGEQHFRRYMDVYKDKANMAPYYKAWNIERFHQQSDGSWSELTPIEYESKILIDKYGNK